LVSIDFNKALQDAKGASFEALPIGDYDIEIAKSEATTSSNGKPMIKVTMRVVTGPYEKRPVMNQFVLSVDNPQAVAIFFRHMKAFGLTEEWFASLGSTSGLEPVANALLGRRARITVGHREWQGEMRNEVKGVKPYTGAPPMAAPPGPTTGPRPPAQLGGPAPIAPPAPVQAPPPPAAPPVPQVQSVPQPPAVPAAVPTSPVDTAPPPTPSEFVGTYSDAQPQAPTVPPTLPV
jgi:uncharacterized protein DUF669